LIAEIALFFGNPLLEPKMRFDNEFAHGILRLPPGTGDCR
jgi:hypothetical protein